MSQPAGDSPTPSVKSVQKAPSSNVQNKRVGFKRPDRPSLIIPPPPGFVIPKSATAATNQTAATNLTIPTAHSPYLYQRKGSVFMFDHLNGIRDFTVNTAKNGEQGGLWFYKKIKKWSRKWFTHIFLFFLIIAYNVGGAVIFKIVEGTSPGSSVEVNLDKERSLIANKLCDMSVQLPVITSDGEYEGAAYRAMLEYDVIIESDSQFKWTFLNAMVFCGTVYTTIGYGHLSPTTVTGKILTIFYSVIGIPLFLIAMTDFGKLFTRCIKFFWSYVRRLYYTGSCRKVRKTAHMKEIMKGAQLMYDIATFRRPSAISNPDESQIQDPNGAPKTTSTLSKTPGSTPTTPAISTFEVDDEFNLPVTLAIFILLLYLIMGALLYCNYIENNSFFDAFYFVFISMSTIGFGDIVPRSSVVMNVSLVYLVFGLALMSMCINVVQDKLSDTFKQASAKLGATIGLRMDDGSVTVVEMPDVHGEMPGVHIGEVADAKEEGRNVTGNFLEVQQEKLGEEKVKRMESERDEKVGSENGGKRKSGEVIVEKVGES